MKRVKRIIGRDKKNASDNQPDDSDKETAKDEDKKHLVPTSHLQSARSLDTRDTGRIDQNATGNTEPFRAFFTAAFATSHLTLDSLTILEGTLAVRQSNMHAAKLNTGLIEKIPEGDMAYIKRMLTMGASPDATCRLDHVSACHIAAFYNNDALVLLLNSGADCSRSDKQGRTPLHLAAWAGNAEQIAVLLKFPEALRKSILNRVTLSPETVEAIKKHTSSIPVNSLMNTPCEPNVEATLPDLWSDGVEHNCRNVKEVLPQLSKGWTALHAASARAQHHCVQLLLAAGADPTAQDKLCRTPLDVAGYAHCMGHKIEVADFTKTVQLLKAYGRFQSYAHENPIDTPLHTAVELGSAEAVMEVLLGGASTTTCNSEGLTAMHICVRNQNKELLQLLANEGNVLEHMDQKGATVLCAAIKDGWLQGVCIALGAGASITMKENGESIIHVAAEMGNIDIFQEILSVAKLNSTIDFRNEKGETALFKAISHDHLDIVKLLLEAGSNIKTKMLGDASVFHVAAKHGNKDILEYLLEFNSNIRAKMINEFDSKGPPLLYAIENNHLGCAELLISKGAKVDLYIERKKSITNDIEDWWSLLHIAASKNHCEIAELILKHDSSTIHAIDSAYQSPLHEACSHGHREMITLLLSKGADLSGFGKGGRNKKAKLTPINILMNNISKPTDFLKKIFDSYISSEGMSLQESKCEVKVDYTILVSNETDSKQMRVIKALMDTGNRYDQTRLLLHPLVESFIYLKWKSLLPFFYSILILHTWFVLSLNIYVVSVFFYKDRNNSKPVPFVLHSNVWAHFIYLTAFLITIQEIIFIKLKNTRYLLCWETVLKILSIILALYLPKVVSWEEKIKEEGPRLIATIALLFSWFEMMFLLSRFPDWGFYVFMFGKVANKVFKILLSFFFLIFGFAITFMIQFRREPPFEGPWSSFVATMVMMTSEFDYNDKINKDAAKELSASIVILRIIFLSFLILVAIVLMNLLTGVAVNDVNNLEIIGSIQRLEKQVELIISLEDIFCNKVFKKILPKGLYNKWIMNKTWKNVIVLRPREATCSNCKRLPARLREAIFETVQLQKTQSDAEHGEMLSQMKLDEIYKVIVKQDGRDTNTSRELHNSVKKLTEEINNMRKDVESMKDFLDKKHRFSNTNSVPLLLLNKS